jgi:hypothetical protein
MPAEYVPTADQRAHRQPFHITEERKSCAEIVN